MKYHLADHRSLQEETYASNSISIKVQQVHSPGDLNNEILRPQASTMSSSIVTLERPTLDSMRIMMMFDCGSLIKRVASSL